jgi:DNA-directed RNA polymerase specialized sigma24 family protein
MKLAESWGIIPLVDGGAPWRPYGSPVLDATVERVYAAARAVAADDESAAEVTRRVLVADPRGCADALTVRGVRLAALTAPHPSLAAMDAPDREAVVLARVLGWTVDAIAGQLEISRADVLGRLGRGLRRTPRPRHDCAAAASPARAVHAS